MANRLSIPILRSVRRSSIAASVLAALGAAVSTLSPCTASAQGRTPVQGAPPNVLLLVDTSGSMERMPNGAMPVCTPGVAGNDPNRWGSILQSLTGSVQPFYSCGRIHRDNATVGPGDMNDTSFRRAYWDSGILGSLSAQAMYDNGYALPHHRPVSGSTADNNTCAIFPDHGQPLISSVFTTRHFDADQLRAYPWEPNPSGNYSFPNGHANPVINPTVEDSNHCVFHQATDGQMDIASQFARFGLMTFDSDPNPGTGSILDLSGVGSLLGLPWLGSLLPGLNLNAGGQWTYLYTNSQAGPQALGISDTDRNPIFPLRGRLLGCADEAPMAVGARNQYAPSWEGPAIHFPSPHASLAQLAQHNTNVQTAILAARPYGGTPIAGMMASAFDYMTRFNGTNAPRNDPYVQEDCRDQYVILLTDGGPNLDLRAQELCSQGQANQAEGTANPLTAPAYCPFYRPAETARQMRTALGGTREIRTIVVGFAVGHDTTSTPTVANDGFPTPAITTCAAWRSTATSNIDFRNQCATQKTLAGSLAAWESTSARACCELHDIAMAGSNDAQGAYFAESQGDLVGVFAQILGSIARESSSRAVPAYANATTIGTTTQSSSLVASFVADPSTGTSGQNGTGSSNIWTGEIDRTRSVCTGGAATDQPINPALGDSFETNLRETATRPRYFFTALPDRVGGHMSSGESIRPLAPATMNDGVVQRNGTEVIVPRTATQNNGAFEGALGASSSDIRDVFDISNNTCKQVTVPGNTRLEKLTNSTACARVMWGFAAAATPTDLPDSSVTPGVGTVTGAYAVRCPLGTGHGKGGVGACKPLGAIIHSSPTIAGAPGSLLRDDGYRKFADYFKDRKQTLYVETTDGLLRALDVNYTGSGSTSTTTSELWSFLPPAVLPELQTNFPGGQRAILDNSPVVKDVVFERGPTQVGQDTAWHTALVAGIKGGGYFALDVSADGQINNQSDFIPSNTPAALASTLRPGSGRPVGPHFLWQLTTTQAAGGTEKGKRKKGRHAKNKQGDDLYSIFGDNVGTPVITTLYINDPADPPGDGQPREVGVAILPGGIDDDVTSSPPSCPRRTSSLPTFSGNETVMAPRPNVRGWGAACGDSVAGRSLTIVRLDNGRIIRHFARANATDNDVPARLLAGGVCSSTGPCRVINSPLDAPITGTPVVFPNDPGAIGQKVFVGDADGTLYRFDISNTNPSQWKAELFLDTRGSSFVSSDFLGDKPIAITPAVSLGDNGSLVINVANGDQEDLGRKVDGSGNTLTNDTHLLWSVTELVGSTTARPQLNWYLRFQGGERVTGPMAVFDRALYFATYRPNIIADHCDDGVARIYGVDYIRPFDISNRALGGAYRVQQLPVGSPPIQFTAEGGDLIPGVAVRASQGCADAVNVNDYFGGTRVGAMMTTPVSYSLVANTSKASGTPGNSVVQKTKPLALPRTQTIVDSWASVVE